MKNSAQLIDHVLQPIARSFPDYLHNSTSLIHTFSDFIVPHDALLVTIDVVSLFPSIPQAECLNIIYQEMNNHTELLLFDPDLIIQLLKINIQNNYFEFGDIIFHQIKGTAMGTAFSPTIANIYMSVFLGKFVKTFQYSPLLLTRYIDDIFIIWPKQQNIANFSKDINSIHPSIKFTITTSVSSIDFLDLTIYKADNTTLQTLNIKTYQKPNNLYQYLEFASAHPLQKYHYRRMHQILKN